MTNVLQDITGGYKSSAKIVDRTLVLSLPDAVSPVVWRMDLGTAKSSAIEVRENDEGHYNLVLKTPKADAYTIAAYALKLKATRALMVVTKALSKAERSLSKEEERGRYLPVPVQTPPKTRITFMNIWWKLTKFILMLFALALLIFGAFMAFKLSTIFSARLNMAQTTQSSQTETSSKMSPTTSKNTPTKKKVGEVMSADDFLRQQ